MTKLIYILLILCLAVPGWAATDLGDDGSYNATKVSIITYAIATLYECTATMTLDSLVASIHLITSGGATAVIGVWNADKTFLDSATVTLSASNFSCIAHTGNAEMNAQVDSGTSYYLGVWTNSTPLAAEVCLTAGTEDKWIRDPAAAFPHTFVPNDSTSSAGNVIVYAYGTAVSKGQVIFIQVFGNYTIDNHWFCNLMRESLFRSFN